jgi:chemotaxis signal transduction protein
MGERSVTTAPVVVAEDSILLQRMIGTALQKAGFTDVKIFNNGQEAWEYLSSIKDDPDLYKKVNLLITDIEMPMMDGHRLTKLVKDDMRLKRIPVVIFSSLINEQMRVKGKEVGADEQLTKPEIGHLVEVLDTLLKRFLESDHAMLVQETE